MKLDKLRKQHAKVNALQAACIAHVYDKDTAVYLKTRAAYWDAFAGYIRAARRAIREAGGLVIGFPCLPWRVRRYQLTPSPAGKPGGED
jgi:hypothetical protein